MNYPKSKVQSAECTKQTGGKQEVSYGLRN